MDEYLAFKDVSPTTLADVLPPGQVVAASIRPLWPHMPRVAGPAYTMRCEAGDNLMLHAAIYRAPPGAIVVVEAGDNAFAPAGGSVCAIAQKRGIAGFVLDGSIRDLAEIRAAEQISVAPMFGLGRRSIWSRASPGRCRHVKPAEKIEREH